MKRKGLRAFKTGYRGGLFKLGEPKDYTGPDVVERQATVIIPVGSVKYISRLEKCLQSVRWQDHINHELIDVTLAYVYNKNEDKSLLYSIADKFGARIVESRKKYEHFPLCLARNIGALSSQRGPHIFVDADAILDPEFLARSLIHEWVLVTCWFSYLKEGHRSNIDKNDVRAIAPSGDIRRAAYGGGMVIPRGVFEKIRGFDEVYDRAWGGDDNDMVDRLVKYGLPWYNLSERENIVNLHQYHPSFVDKSSPSVIANRKRYRDVETVVRNRKKEWGKR